MKSFSFQIKMLLFIMHFICTFSFRISQYPGAGSLVVTSLNQVPDIQMGMVDTMAGQNIRISTDYNGCISQCTSPPNWAQCESMWRLNSVMQASNDFNEDLINFVENSHGDPSRSPAVSLLSSNRQLGSSQ
jgi:hypothetical protein